MPTKDEIRKQTTYVDRPELSEVYVDFFENASFDGQTAQFTFSVVRWDEPKPPAPPTGKRLTACRMVMPAAALIDLANTLENIMRALQAQGTVKRPQAGTPTKQ
jgi:hypothetical protein